MSSTDEPRAAGRPVSGEPPGLRVPELASTRHPNAKSLVKWVVAVAAAGLAIYVVFPSLAQVIGTWPQLSTLSPGWLVAGVLAEVVSFTCTFALQRLVLQTNGWFAVVTAGLTGNAVTNVLPGGDAVGASVQFRMLAAAGIDPDTAAGGLTASSLLGIGGLLALPIFTLPAILGGSDVSRGLVHAALFGLGGFVLYALCGIVVLTTDRPLALLGRVAQWLWNNIPGHHHAMTDLDCRLLRQRDTIRSALGRKGRSAVLLIAGRLGFDFLCLLAALRATAAIPVPFSSFWPMRPPPLLPWYRSRPGVSAWSRPA